MKDFSPSQQAMHWNGEQLHRVYVVPARFYDLANERQACAELLSHAHANLLRREQLSRLLYLFQRQMHWLVPENNWYSNYNSTSKKWSSIRTSMINNVNSNSAELDAVLMTRNKKITQKKKKRNKKQCS